MSAPASPSAVPAPPRAIAGNDLALFGGTVLVWGTTWLALKYQLGVVAPQVSLLWRFALAAPLMAFVCVLMRNPLRFRASMHLRFMALGVFLYSTNFLLFYNAGHYLVSGLLSVVFSLASLTNIGLSVLVLGERLRMQVLIGAGLGLTAWRSSSCTRRMPVISVAARWRASRSACSAASPSRSET